MSFMYPRTIAVHRPPAQSGVGFQAPYAGQDPASETVVVTGLPASVQVRREGQKSPTGLPGDGTKPTWYIFIKRGAMKAKGFADSAIQNLDVIIDELGNRYQVIAPYFDSMGPRPTVELLDP